MLIYKGHKLAGLCWAWRTWMPGSFIQSVTVDEEWLVQVLLTGEKTALFSWTPLSAKYSAVFAYGVYESSLLPSPSTAVEAEQYTNVWGKGKKPWKNKPCCLFMMSLDPFGGLWPQVHSVPIMNAHSGGAQVWDPAKARLVTATSSSASSRHRYPVCPFREAGDERWSNERAALAEVSSG